MRSLKTSTSIIALCIFLMAQATLFAADIPFGPGEVEDSSLDGYLNISLGDLSRDGKDDILGVSSNDDTVFFLKSGSGSSFSYQAVSTAFNGAYCVKSGDIDHDGDLDIIACAYFADDIAWWENTDSWGTAWVKHTVDDFFDGVQCIHVEDVDGDGDLDILGAANTADELGWWENTAGDASAWTRHQLAAGVDGAKWISAADMDNDGDMDILAAAFNDDQLIILRQGKDKLGKRIWLQGVIAGANGPTQIQPADMDHDGDMDVIATASQSDRLVWIENRNGAATNWIGHNISTTYDGATTICAADLDRDGDMDITAGAYNADNVGWWENTSGDGSAWSAHMIDALDGPRSVVVADINGDANPDVVACAYPGNKVIWWPNEMIQHPRTFHPSHTVYDDYPNIGDLKVADIDQDGDPDIVACSTSVGYPVWLENVDGLGTDWALYPIQEFGWGRSFSIDVGDLDGDGDPDVACASERYDSVAWWVNPGTRTSEWERRDISTNFTNAASVSLVDMDCDGDLDVLATSQGDEDEDIYGTVVWWANVGNGAFLLKHTVDAALQYAYDAKAADLDHDGDIDIAAVSKNNLGFLKWYKNLDGNATSWDPETLEVLYRPVNVHIHDMLDNNRMDIVVGGQSGQLSWYENSTGWGTNWFFHVIDSNIYLSKFAIGKIDSDNKYDILTGVSYSDDSIIVLKALIGASRWQYNEYKWDYEAGPYFRPYQPTAFAVADMDRDGDNDIIAGGNNAFEINWWENKPTTKADIVEDGRVDLADFALLAEEWMFGED